MGLTNEQEKAREEDANVRYLSQNICNKDGDKDFVFISYKSDDWEIVLKEIVYKLVKEYGLNIYFDGDFKDNNPHWTTQFPDNMESDKCKGVLVFLDDKYATSYATLMELMHSQFGCQDALYNFVSKPVVPINLVKALSVIDDESDTGLGKAFYSNGEKVVAFAAGENSTDVYDIDNGKKLFTIPAVVAATSSNKYIIVCEAEKDGIYGVYDFHGQMVLPIEYSWEDLYAGKYVSSSKKS